MIQKKNIKQMSTSGGEFRVAEIEGRGRALVAAQTLRAGQIILRDSPILLYSAFPLFPSSASSSPYNSYCDCCFRTLQTSSSSSSLRSVYPCPECSLHLFCSPKCLTAALSSSHSPWVCKSLRLLRDCPSIHQQPVECQVQVRFLIAAYNLAHVFPSHFKTLLSLQGLGSGLNSTDSITPSAQLLHSLISSLCTPPPPPSIPLPQEGWFSMDLSATLLAKDKLNAFGLMEPFSECQRSVRAYGIYPKAAFFNHDCLPNACRFDYVDTATSACNTDIIVRMIHDVPQGREICLSYFPVNENYPNRQRRLLEDYGFTCQCDRCKVEANWSDIDNDDPDVEQGDDVMDEDTDQHMGVASESDNSDGAQADSGFPHAYFFLRYMCSRNNCWGTLAPLPSTGDSSSNIMECNVCGDLKNDDDIGGDGQDELSMDESAVA